MAAAAVLTGENEMEIRRLEKEEHIDTRGLYEAVFFEDSSSFVDYYYTEKIKDNQIYTICEDGSIQAMLHLNPYILMVNQAEKPVNYIVAVATRREYRKRGFMAALLRTALCAMYEEGQPFTFLMPAAEKIYLPYDFRTVYEQKRKICGSEEAIFKAAAKEGMEVIQAEAENALELAHTAEDYLSAKYQVYAKRSAPYYVRLLKEISSDGGKLYLFRKNRKIVDYCIYDTEYTEEKQTAAKIMVRIVDVRRMLMSVGLKELTAACFTVTDPVISGNNKCFMITGTEFSGVTLMEGRPENSEGQLTIGALSSFLFGAKSVEEICYEEGVEMSVRLKEELEKIVPLSHIFLNEAV